MALVLIGSATAFMVVMIGGSLVMYARFYRRILPNQALIVTTPRGPLVAMSGGILVFPIINTAEVIDLSFRALTIEAKGVATKDDVPVDVTATFRLRVNATTEDILAVGRTVGCARAVDPTALRELFGSRCTSALTAAVRASKYASLREELEDRAVQELGVDLSGYVADGVGIESVAKA